MVWTGPVTEEEAAAWRAAKVEAGWVLRSTAPAAPHTCDYPSPGRHGDLWRCYRCHRLWRASQICQICGLEYPRSNGAGCDPTIRWLPAHLWQRLRYWRRG